MGTGSKLKSFTNGTQYTKCSKKVAHKSFSLFSQQPFGILI